MKLMYIPEIQFDVLDNKHNLLSSSTTPEAKLQLKCKVAESLFYSS